MYKVLSVEHRATSKSGHRVFKIVLDTFDKAIFYTKFVYFEGEYVNNFSDLIRVYPRNYV